MSKDNKVLELWIGKILLGSVVLALLMILTGGGWYLSQHATLAFNEGVFHGEPLKYTTLTGALMNIGSPLGLIQAGLLLIIAGQLLRVVLTGVIFYLERDKFFMATCAIILCVMIVGFIRF